MLKVFITKEVGLQYTAVRKSRQAGGEKTKDQFKSTELCKCMDGKLYFLVFKIILNDSRIIYLYFLL